MVHIKQSKQLQYFVTSDLIKWEISFLNMFLSFSTSQTHSNDWSKNTVKKTRRQVFFPFLFLSQKCSSQKAHKMPQDEQRISLHPQPLNFPGLSRNQALPCTITCFRCLNCCEDVPDTDRIFPSFSLFSRQ